MNEKHTLSTLLARTLLASSVLLGVGLLSATATAEIFDEDKLLITNPANKSGIFDEDELLITNQANKSGVYDEDDLLTAGADESSGGTSITDYIVGEFGLTNANNDAVKRSSTIYNLGVNIPFSFGRFYATYGGVETEVSITQSLRNPDAIENIDSNGNPLPDERIRTLTSDDVNLREAFIQLNLGPAVTFYVGRQRNPWGQFDLFSPAVLMQPLNANFTSLLPSKLDLLQPQDQRQASIFLSSRAELSIYRMSSLRTDSIAEDNIVQQYKFDDDGELTSNGELASDPNFDEDFNVILDANALAFERVKNPKQSAGRLAFYPNWGTFAFTHHNGYNAIRPLLRTPLDAGVIRSDGTLDTDSVSIVESVYVDKRNSYLYYPEGILNAFEISIPIGKWTWRYETAIIESVSGLDGFVGHVSLKADAGDIFTKDSVDAFIAASNATTRDRKLRGTALFRSKTTTTAAGFQYQGAEWRIELTLLDSSNAEPTTQAGRNLLAAYQALEAQQGSQVEEENNSPDKHAPFFNGFRRDGDEDQHTYGFSLGALGVGFGLGFLYSYNFTEDLSLGFSTGNIGLTDSNSNDSIYKTNSEGRTIQTSLAWRF